MAKLFSKREWLGAVLLVVGVVALAVFILQVVLVVKWVGWDYTGPMKIGALWDWVNSPANREKLEPLVSLITIIASLAIGAVSLLLGWLRKNADRAPDGTTAAKPTRWDSIRGDLIRTVRKHWIEDFQAQSLFEGVRIRLGGKKTPEAIAHPYEIERKSTRSYR